MKYAILLMGFPILCMEPNQDKVRELYSVPHAKTYNERTNLLRRLAEQSKIATPCIKKTDLHAPPTAAEAALAVKILSDMARKKISPPDRTDTPRPEDE